MSMSATNGRPAPPAGAPRRMNLAAATSGVDRGPPRIFVYGVGGVGKTTFLSEAPSPVFIDTQGGTEELDVTRFPKPHTWTDVLDAVDELIVTEHSHKTLVIDLVDDVEQMLFAHLCKQANCANITEYGGGFNKGFDAAVPEWRNLVARLERLRREKQMIIGFVAHSTVKSFKNPEGPDYDRYQTLMNEKGSGFLRGWCTAVLLARHSVTLKVDKKKTRGVSTGARVLQTVETAAYYAKNRYNLPDTLSLDWVTFWEAVQAGQPASPDALRAEITELMQQLDEATREKVASEVAKSGEDAARLVRVLNKLRERVQPQEQQPTTESAT